MNKLNKTETRVKEEYLKKGWFVFKPTYPSLIAFKRGKIKLIEVKDSTSRLSEQEVDSFTALQSMGLEVGFIKFPSKSLGKFDEIIFHKDSVSYLRKLNKKREMVKEKIKKESKIEKQSLREQLEEIQSRQSNLKEYNRQLGDVSSLSDLEILEGKFNLPPIPSLPSILSLNSDSPPSFEKREEKEEETPDDITTILNKLAPK